MRAVRDFLWLCLLLRLLQTLLSLSVVITQWRGRASAVCQILRLPKSVLRIRFPVCIFRWEPLKIDSPWHLRPSSLDAACALVTRRSLSAQVPLTSALPLADKPHLLQPTSRKEELFGRPRMQETYKYRLTSMSLTRRETEPRRDNDKDDESPKKASAEKAPAYAALPHSSVIRSTSSLQNQQHEGGGSLRGAGTSDKRIIIIHGQERLRFWSAVRWCGSFWAMSPRSLLFALVRCRQWRNWRFEPGAKVIWRRPTSQHSEECWEMMVDPDVDVCTETLNHRKIIRKRTKTTTCWKPKKY